MANLSKYHGTWSLSVKDVLQELIPLQAGAIKQLLELLEENRERLAAKFEGATDPAHLELLAEEASDLNAWSREMAELQLVAAYHWFERESKSIGARLPGEDRASTARLKFPDLKSLYQRHGVDWDRQPGFDNINLLRLVANSWKHNPSDASNELLRELALQRPGGTGLTYGILKYEPIELAIRRRLALTTREVTHFDVVDAFVTHVTDFLLLLVKQAPLL